MCLRVCSRQEEEPHISEGCVYTAREAFANPNFLDTPRDSPALLLQGYACTVRGPLLATWSSYPFAVAGTLALLGSGH